MPLIKTIKKQDFCCYIWRVTETMDALYALMPEALRQKYRKEAQKRFTSERRKMEFVAVRALLSYILPDTPVIAYHDSGKPYLVDSDLCLSVSHTADVVAVALSRSEVGVDVERYGERVCRVAPRFLNEKETAEGVWEKLLLWSAKETVYKMMNCMEVDFCKHLISEGLHLSDEGKTGSAGSFLMHAEHPLHQHIYQIDYELFPDFVFTCSVDR